MLDKTCRWYHFTQAQKIIKWWVVPYRPVPNFRASRSCSSGASYYGSWRSKVVKGSVGYSFSCPSVFGENMSTFHSLFPSCICFAVFATLDRYTRWQEASYYVDTATLDQDTKFSANIFFFFHTHSLEYDNQLQAIKKWVNRNNGALLYTRSIGHWILLSVRGV